MNRITRAFDTLADAYNNNTLLAGHCAACAVGNLVSKAMGYKLEPEITHTEKVQNVFNCEETLRIFARGEEVGSIRGTMMEVRTPVAIRGVNSAVKAKTWSAKVVPMVAERFLIPTPTDCLFLAEADAQIAATEFTKDELVQIERVFEEFTEHKYSDYPSDTYHELSDAEIKADQLRGLEAVATLLATFDEEPVDVQTQFIDKLETIQAC